MLGNHSHSSQTKRSRLHSGVVDGLIETSLPEIHRPIRVEDTCECAPTNNAGNDARSRDNNGPNNFTSLFTVPCPLFETIKRLVNKKPEPCKQQHKLKQKPKANPQTKDNKLRKTNQSTYGFPRHQPQCRCHGEQQSDRKLRLEIFIPEKYFSPPERTKHCKATKVYDGRGGPVKDAVKKAVSDMQSRINEESRTRLPSRPDRAYDRHRKCFCVAGNKNIALPSENEQKTFVCDRTSVGFDSKPSRIEKKPVIIQELTDDDDDNVFEFEEHFSESQLAKKLQDLAVENPTDSSWYSAQSSEKPDDGYLTEKSEDEGDYGYVKEEAESLPEAEHVQSVTDYEDEVEKEVDSDEPQQENAKSETSAAESQNIPATFLENQSSSVDDVATVEERVVVDVDDNSSAAAGSSAGDNAGDNDGDNAGDSAGDIASKNADLKVEVNADASDVVNVVENGADNTANNSNNNDAALDAGITVNSTDNTDNNADLNAGLAVDTGDSVADSAVNAVVRVYSSASNVLKTVASNIEVNKDMLMAIIALLIFIIGMLLLYLLSRKCVYKKTRIYRGNCHLFG